MQDLGQSHPRHGVRPCHRVLSDSRDRARRPAWVGRRDVPRL